MNKDQVKGQAKKIAGKVQDAKAAKLQAQGKAQKGVGDAGELVKDARDAAQSAARSHS